MWSLIKLETNKSNIKEILLQKSNKNEALSQCCFMGLIKTKSDETSLD